MRSSAGRPDWMLVFSIYSCNLCPFWLEGGKMEFKRPLCLWDNLSWDNVTKPQIISVGVLTWTLAVRVALLRRDRYHFFLSTRYSQHLLLSFAMLKLVRDVRTGPVCVASLIYPTGSFDFVGCSCALPGGELVNPINPIAPEDTVIIYTLYCP